YEETANSNVVVITSGLPRKPGMSRDDLLFNNMKIIKSVVENTIKYSPDCVIIIVTNPLDAMAQLALHLTKFPKNRIMGMGGVLDTARFRAIVSSELNVSVEDVSACILGAHGDTMVPIPRLTTIGCIPLTEMVSEETLARIMKRSISSGAEIVSLLKTGSAFYAPGTSAAYMAKAIVQDKKRIMPVSAYLDGEYGLKDVFIGVPAKLGKNGIEHIYELKLTAEESTALKKSAQSVMELVNLMKLS
ncbi:MAG: malate dehydrogenase, partial [Chloroflexi bacterium]|nr:malate dehydrogenase [Chloroflexota bacterium]